MTRDPIKNIAVVGAGTMGHALALIFAQHGYQVRIWSLYQNELDRAADLIESALNSLIISGQIHEEKRPGTIRRISYSTNLEVVADNADFILEAVSENLEIKKELFSRLGKICSEQTIFASNTSGLNIFEMTEISHPERLIITHWFSPPTLVPLVEIIPGPKTSEEVISTTVALLEGMGKKTVRLKKFIPSFIVNRIQNAINKVMLEMIDNDWATPEDIDTAIKYTLGVRLPVVGIAQSLDFAGLDLIQSVMKQNGINSHFLEKKVADGDLGIKSLKGIYNYKDRQETEILEKRDNLYIKIREFLEELDVFKPV